MESAYPLDDNFTTDGTGISAEIKGYLKETAKWSKFLSIVGFVMVGIMVIAGLIMGTVGASAFSALGPDAGPMGMLGGGMFMVIYLLLALLYFFPTLYLYRFSSKMQTALNSDSQNDLTESFKNLKSVFKFWGIFTAIFIGLYALMFLIGLGGLATM